MADIKFVKKLWEESKENDIHIYIDIPFCINQCRYCIYKGMQISMTNAINKIIEPFDINIMEKYAEDLIKQISELKEIIKSKNIVSIYVGGGTPNLMPVHLLKSIFDSIPNFKAIKTKVVDVNPKFLNIDFVNMLVEYNFSLITYGIQSFNEDVLKYQKRAHLDAHTMKSIVDQVRITGLAQSIDLMCYMLNYDDKDLDIFENDLNLAMDMNIDFITATPEFFALNQSPELGVKFGKRLEKIMKENKLYFPEYQYDSDVYPSNLEWRHVNRIIKREHKDIFKDMVVYYGNAYSAAVHPIMSFGTSIGSNEVMSYIPDEFYYVSKKYKGNTVFDIKFKKEV